MTLLLQAQYKQASREYKACIFSMKTLGEKLFYFLNHCAARLAK